jgi:hypothetical protein
LRIPDVNLLLYAYDRNAPLHDAARHWLEARFNDGEPFGFAMASIVSFVRISTSARILLQPFRIDEACGIVDAWLQRPSVLLVTAMERHWRTFVDLAVASQACGALVPDADLAATVIEHGAILCTNDRDFSRFPNLRVEYPLAA